jgi:hypothetical protein
MKRIGLPVLICLVALLGVAGTARAESPFAQWSDQGIVYAAPSGSAYYPSVIYRDDLEGKVALVGVPHARGEASESVVCPLGSRLTVP